MVKSEDSLSETIDKLIQKLPLILRIISGFPYKFNDIHLMLFYDQNKLTKYKISDFKNYLNQYTAQYLDKDNIKNNYNLFFHILYTFPSIGTIPMTFFSESMDKLKKYEEKIEYYNNEIKKNAEERENNEKIMKKYAEEIDKKNEEIKKYAEKMEKKDEEIKKYAEERKNNEEIIKRYTEQMEKFSKVIQKYDEKIKNYGEIKRKEINNLIENYNENKTKEINEYKKEIEIKTNNYNEQKEVNEEQNNEISVLLKKQEERNVSNLKFQNIQINNYELNNKDILEMNADFNEIDKDTNIDDSIFKDIRKKN